MSKLFFSTVLAFSLMLNFAAAKEYDLQTILNLADEQNHEIKLARADLQFASAQKKEAWSTALPKVNVTMDYSRNFLDNFFYVTVTDSLGRQETNRFAISFNNEFQMNAILNQTLFSFGKIGNAIQAANYYDRYTDYQYSYQWQEVMTRVKKAFYQAMLAEKVLQVAIQSEESARDNYENIQLKFESGTVSEFDLLQAEVRWQNSIPETMQARKNYELAVNHLKMLVDIPLREEIRLIGDFELFPPPPDTIHTDRVFENRPDYNALIWEKRLQEKRVAVEFSNHLPNLNANLIYSYGARSDAFRLENDNDNVLLAVNLSIPVFSGGYTSAQVQKARIDVERVNTRIQMMHDQVRVQLQNIYLRLDEAQQRIVAARKSVETARRSFEIAETRTRNGLATQLELKDSRVFLDRAQLNYYSAIYDYLDAYFDWELATGNVRQDEF